MSNPDQIKYFKTVKEEIIQKRSYLFPPHNYGTNFSEYCAFFREKYKLELSNFSTPGSYTLEALDELFKDNIVCSNWLVTQQGAKMLFTIIQVNYYTHVSCYHIWDDNKCLVAFDIATTDSQYFLDLMGKLEKYSIHKEKEVIASLGFGGFATGK